MFPPDQKSSSNHSSQRADVTSQSTGSQGSKGQGLGSKAREKRRNWQIGSVEFTTADGQRQRVRPPGVLGSVINWCFWRNKQYAFSAFIDNIYILVPFS